MLQPIAVERGPHNPSNHQGIGESSVFEDCNGRQHRKKVLQTLEHKLGGRSFKSVLQSNLLTLRENGKEFQIAPPTDMSSMFSLDGVLILQSTSSGVAGTPAVFTLSDPLSEMKPVKTKSVSMKTTNAEDEELIDKFESRKLLFATEATPVPVVVLFDSKLESHAICVVRSVVSETSNLITPDVSFDEVWCGMKSSSPAKKIFPLSLADGTGLCLAGGNSSQVEFISLCSTEPDLSSPAVESGSTTDLVSAIECTSVCSIAALDVTVCQTKKWRVDGQTKSLPRYVVVVDENEGKLWLYCGADRVIEVAPKWPVSRDVGSITSADPTDNGCAFTFNDGSKFSVQIDGLAPAMAETQLALSALYSASIASDKLQSSSTLSDMNRKNGFKLIRCSDAREVLIKFLEQYLPAADGAGSDWGAFCAGCHNLFNKAMKKTSTGTAAKSTDKSLWLDLVSSSSKFLSLDNDCFSNFESPLKDNSAPTTNLEFQFNESESSDDRWLAECLLLILHLVYEEAKTNVLNNKFPLMAALLTELSCRLGWRAFMRYYLMDHEHVLQSLSTSVIETEVKGPKHGGGATCSSKVEEWFWKDYANRPPSLDQFLAASIRRETFVEVFPVLETSSRCARLCKIFKSSNHQKPQSILESYVENGFGYSQLSAFPTSVAIQLQSAMQKLRASDQQTTFTTNLSSEWFRPSEKPDDAGPTDDDGTHISKDITHKLFNKDLRLKEVQRLLTSGELISINVQHDQEMSEHDFAAEQKYQLQVLSQAAMAVPVGRGMYTLNTIRPLITQAIKVPSLMLNGRSNTGATISLAEGDMAADQLVWPRFHNGVAAGLRILPPGHTNLSTTWIAYHRPSDDQLKDEHAGFIMALGLLGHLRGLAPMTCYDYLSTGHDTTCSGLLLGMAAAYRGSMDPDVAKLLSIHVSALLPITSAEIDISPMVASAAIIGVGLLYQETAHRRITEVLLAEIGRITGPKMTDTCTRESHAFCAGLALGMVVLGKGNDIPALADLQITEKLRQYIEGTTELERGANAINVDMTCPGATIALGLMYLRSGNRTIAFRLEVPDTQFLLDFIRPDCLLLRVLARALVMWDDIEPSIGWVEGNCPQIVARHKLDGKGLESSAFKSIDKDLLKNAYINICAGACCAIGLKYVGSNDSSAIACLRHYMRMFSTDQSSFAQTATCVALVAISLIEVGTGSLDTLRFIRSLRKKTIQHAASIMKREREREGQNFDGKKVDGLGYGTHMAISMACGILFLGGGRKTFNNSNQSIAAIIAAIFPTFPSSSNDNRYHLQALRHLYVLATVPKEDVEVVVSSQGTAQSQGNKSYPDELSTAISEVDDSLVAHVSEALKRIVEGKEYAWFQDGDLKSFLCKHELTFHNLLDLLESLPLLKGLGIPAEVYVRECMTQYGWKSPSMEAIIVISRLAEML